MANEETGRRESKLSQIRNRSREKTSCLVPGGTNELQTSETFTLVQSLFVLSSAALADWLG